MIRETLPLAGTPFVELIAVMPKYSPFAEKAGMRRVGVQVSVKYVSKISSVLLEWGFDMQFLGSERYVTNKLEGLSPAELGMLREVFRCNRHPRFRKEFGGVGCRQIFFTRVDWEVAIGVADLVKFAKLIRVVGVLLQKFTCFGLVPMD